MLYLNAVREAVPEERVSVDALQHRHRLPPAELTVFRRIYGFDQVPVSRQPIGDLVEEAARGVIERSGVDPRTVRWLIHTHTGTQLTVPGDPMLGRVCRRLGLPPRTIAFGMTENNCASTISALRLVERLLATVDEESHAILVVADTAFTPTLQIIPNASITGDGAVACLLSRRGPGHRVLATRLDVYGQHARCLWELDRERAEFDAEYPQRVIRSMEGALEDAGLAWSDVRCVLPHNINTYSWRRIAREAGIPIGLIYLDQVPRLAHCFGADTFINLAIAARERRFSPGDHLLLVTVGLGAVFGAAVVRYQCHEGDER
jgi:3-oxoacyl-[acyl-carrier-protein] synthase-3